MNEFSLLQELLKGVPAQAEGLMCGVGDDCAVITASGSRDWIITTDAFVEGIHFKRDWGGWDILGRKGFLSSVSDIAAMGGKPRFAIVTMAIPDDVPASSVSSFYGGLRSAADEYQTIIAGGDTVRSRRGLYADLTVIGEVQHGRAIYRRGARPGDGVYLTGNLGGSRAGLEILGRKLHGAAYAPFVERHLKPSPRVAAGQWLAATGCLTAMIDVSDGLLLDLGHIAAAGGVGMTIEAIRVPIFPGLEDIVGNWGTDPLSFACSSGEEYELVFTVAGAREDAFRRFLPAAEATLGHSITKIGVVNSSEEITVLDALGNPVSLANRGYMHEFSD